MYNYNIPHKLDSLIMNKNKANFSLIIWLFYNTTMGLCTDGFLSMCSLTNFMSMAHPGTSLKCQL